MFPILMYHQIGMPPPKGTRLRGSTVHPKRFESQMRWLKRLGYQGLSLSELLPYVKGEKTGKVFGITFDDGYRNVYENALPVLRGFGFSSTNFIVTGEINGENYWAQGTGSLPSKMMNEAQILDWNNQGQEIGSHTVSHAYMAKISKEEALEELRKSKRVLEEMLQKEVPAFCYPYGSESLEVRQWVKEVGYKIGVSTQRGLVRNNEDVFALPRVSVLRSTHLLHFLRKTITHYEDRKRYV